MVKEMLTVVLHGKFLLTVTVSLVLESHHLTHRLSVISPTASVGRARQLPSCALPEVGHMPDILHHCEQATGSHVTSPKNEDDDVSNFISKLNSPLRPVDVEQM